MQHRIHVSLPLFAEERRLGRVHENLARLGVSAKVICGDGTQVVEAFLQRQPQAQHETLDVAWGIASPMAASCCHRAVGTMAFTMRYCANKP